MTNGKNKLNSAEMRKLGKMNVVAVFFKIENELTLAMNHVKALKSLMKNVTERLTALEQETSTPGKTTIWQLKYAQF